MYHVVLWSAPIQPIVLHYEHAAAELLNLFSGRLAPIDAFLGDISTSELALTALAVQGQLYGWSAERLERLEAFRTDPEALVAAAAQFTLTPEG